MIISRWRKRRGLEEVQFHLQWWLVTHGTASHGQLRPQVQTLPLVEAAHPAPPARVAQRARNGVRPALHAHLLVTKVSETSDLSKLPF